MSTKMGRPKSEITKDIDLKVRIDRNTNAALEKYAKEHNLNWIEFFTINELKDWLENG